MDSIYDVRPPSQSIAESLVSDALADSQEPADVVRRIRPPLAMIEEFPPRFGYPDYPERALTIREVLGENRLYPDNRDWLSGRDANGGIEASTRNAQVNGQW